MYFLLHLWIGVVRIFLCFVFLLVHGILACVSKFWYSDGGYCKRGFLCGPGFLFYGRSVGDLYSFLILFSVF